MEVPSATAQTIDGDSLAISGRFDQQVHDKHTEMSLLIMKPVTKFHHQTWLKATKELFVVHTISALVSLIACRGSRRVPPRVFPQEADRGGDHVRVGPRAGPGSHQPVPWCTPADLVRSRSSGRACGWVMRRSW